MFDSLGASCLFLMSTAFSELITNLGSGAAAPSAAAPAAAAPAASSAPAAAKKEEPKKEEKKKEESEDEDMGFGKVFFYLQLGVYASPAWIWFVMNGAAAVEF